MTPSPRTDARAPRRRWGRSLLAAALAATALAAGMAGGRTLGDRAFQTARAAQLEEADRAFQASLVRQDPTTSWRTRVMPLMGASASAAPQSSEPPTPAELEALRDRIEGFFVDADTVMEMLPEAQRYAAAERLAGSHEAVAQLTEEELMAIDEAFAAFPDFWDVTGFGVAVLDPDIPAPSADRMARMLLPVAGGALPNEANVPAVGPGSYDNCGDFSSNWGCPGCPQYPDGNIYTVFALNTATFVAESVCSFFDGDVLITGAETPNPAKIICVLITAALDVTATAVELAFKLADECLQRIARHDVNVYLDTYVSSRASQKSHDFHRLSNLRLALEDAMLQEGDIRLSAFQMPEAYGGFLDTEDDISVRWVVSDTIKMQMAAGYDVRNAEVEYAAAENHLANGEYKDAFARYRLAYRAAVRVGREP